MKKGVLSVVSLLTGVAAGYGAKSYFSSKELAEKSGKVDKFKSYYNMLNQWLMLKQSGKSLVEYFEKNGYHNIAVYGMGEMGNRLFEELKDSSITIQYGIDKNATGTYAEIAVVEPDQINSEVDVIVVSAVFAFDEIQMLLSERVNCPIISLEDIVYES